MDYELDYKVWTRGRREREGQRGTQDWLGLATPKI